MHYFRSNISILNSYTWLMATIFVSTEYEHFYHHRKFYWPALLYSHEFSYCSVSNCRNRKKGRITYRKLTLKSKRRIACITTKATQAKYVSLLFPLHG